MASNTYYARQSNSYNRARDLFFSCLTEKEKKQFISEGRITIKGSLGGRYIIPHQSSTFIEALDKPYLMCYTVFEIPYYDKILAQKILIETREDIFLENCNCWDMGDASRKDWAFTIGDYIGNGYGEKKRDTA